MSEPEFLESQCARRQCAWTRSRRLMQRIICRIEDLARRAIAKPAKSAVGLAALGVIAAVLVRGAIFGQGPSPAAAAVRRIVPVAPPNADAMKGLVSPARGKIPGSIGPFAGPDNELREPILGTGLGD